VLPNLIGGRWEEDNAVPIINYYQNLWETKLLILQISYAIDEYLRRIHAPKIGLLYAGIMIMVHWTLYSKLLIS
jgi:hypothetical protein